VVDRLDETECGDLVEVFEGFAAPLEADGDALRHGEPDPDQFVAERLALRPLGQPREPLEVGGGVGGVVMRVLLRSAGDGHEAHLPQGA
jgi:hypothetical protein